MVCQEPALFINPFNAILNRFLSIPPLVAVAKFDATQQGPCATTVSEDPIHASMTLCQSGGALISVRGRVNDHVKSALQMVLSLHPRNADALPIQPRNRPSDANFPRPKSRRISSTIPSVFLPPPSAIRIVIPTSKIITTHTQVVNLRPRTQTSGCRRIKTTTRCAGPDPTASRPTLSTPVHQHDMAASYRRPSSYMYDQGSYTKSSYPRQLDVNTFQFPDTLHRNPIPTSPTIESEQRTWWDKINRQYE